MQMFNEVQKLLSKTNGKAVGDLMTPAPVVVRESTNLEDAARSNHLQVGREKHSEGKVGVNENKERQRREATKRKEMEQEEERNERMGMETEARDKGKFDGMKEEGVMRMEAPSCTSRIAFLFSDLK
ncbi:hypothetical protein LguiB_019410 [Lonicera macranthoides]